MKALKLGIAVFALAPFAAAADPAADFYHGKTVKIVIGASMGGSYGLFAQFAARHINKHLAGSPTVVVQTMPGSGGNKAMNYTYTAGPQDGSMVSLVQISVVQEALFNPKIHFDARGFKYIGRFTDINIVSTAHKRSGIRSMDDAKRKSYSFGTIGRRNFTYIGAAVMNSMGGTKFKVISGYPGTKQSYLAMERGEVDVAATSWTTLQVRDADKLKDGTYIPIFQMTTKRSPELPNVPTITEFGRNRAEKAFTQIMGAGGAIGRSMAGPPGMPRHLVAAWDKAFAAMMADPAFVADVTKRKATLNPLTGGELTDLVLGVMNMPKEDIKGAFGVYTKLLKAKF